MKHLMAAGLLVVLATGVASGFELTEQARLTGPDEFAAEVLAPQLARPETQTGRRMRAYPEQPPTIPHEIEGYQLSVNTNRCLTCHQRQYTEQTGAPMVSITHFVDRDGQMLAEVSRRRYFCTQCHVTQTTARPLIENVFIDMSELRQTPQGPSSRWAA